MHLSTGLREGQLPFFLMLALERFGFLHRPRHTTTREVAERLLCLASLISFFSFFPRARVKALLLSLSLSVHGKKASTLPTLQPKCNLDAP